MNYRSPFFERPFPAPVVDLCIFQTNLCGASIGTGQWYRIDLYHN